MSLIARFESRIARFAKSLAIIVPQKGVVKKGIGKKVTKNEREKGYRKVTENEKKVIEKWPTKRVSGPTPFAYPLLRHVEVNRIARSEAYLKSAK